MLKWHISALEGRCSVRAWITLHYLIDEFYIACTCYCLLCFYGVFWYLSSIAVLTTTTRDMTLEPCTGPRTHPLHRSEHSSQLTLWLHDYCLDVLTVYVNECACLGPMHIRDFNGLIFYNSIKIRRFIIIHVNHEMMCN